MESEAVSDTGPMLHLSEINFFEALDIFSQVYIPQEVAHELKKYRTSIPSKIRVTEIASEWEDTVKVLTNQNDLDLGEACALTLALQKKVSLFLTDDLDARVIGKNYNLEVHGTIGILMRAFKEKIIDKKTVVEKIIEINRKSTLFITSDLIKLALQTIEDFSRKRS